MLLAVCVMGLLVPVAGLGDEGGDDGAPMMKESCVDPGELDIIRDGMMLVYGNKDDEAAEWFTEKCKNATVGAHSDMCTCFYWAYRAQMVRALTPFDTLQFVELLANGERPIAFLSRLIKLER